MSTAADSDIMSRKLSQIHNWTTIIVRQHRYHKTQQQRSRMQENITHDKDDLCIDVSGSGVTPWRRLTDNSPQHASDFLNTRNPLLTRILCHWGVKVCPFPLTLHVGLATVTSDEMEMFLSNTDGIQLNFFSTQRHDWYSASMQDSTHSSWIIWFISWDSELYRFISFSSACAVLTEILYWPYPSTFSVFQTTCSDIQDKQTVPTA